MADFTLSLVDKSIKNGVESEKCVVPNYKTTLKQKEVFEEHLHGCNMAEIPIEWVIDIADESNGWFFATAYKFDDQKNMLFVMVPDKESATYSGWVALDHRTVHLVECQDSKTDALFNKIVRDSVIKVKWDIEWFEEFEDDEADPNNDGGGGEWVASTARYYLRMINQILVEDSESAEPDIRSYIMLLADSNVKLLQINHGDKNHEDFFRLVREGIVVSSPELKETAHKFFISSAKSSSSTSKEGPSPPINSAKFPSNSNNSLSRDPSQKNYSSKDSSKDSSGGGGSSEIPTIKKLAEASSLLRQNIIFISEEREAKKKKMFKYSKAFRSFAIEKDLMAANALFEEFSTLNMGKSNKAENDANNSDPDSDDVNAEETMNRAKTIEEGLEDFLNIDNDDIQPILEEIDSLRKTHKNMLRILEIRDKEILRLQKKLES